MASLRGADMDLVDHLAKTYTGVVHDVMLELGLRDFTCRRRSGPCSRIGCWPAWTPR